MAHRDASSGTPPPLSTTRTQRRELHREVVARSRVRQRERVTLLVKQEAALRQQLTTLLLTRLSTEDTPSATRQLYTALVETQEKLLNENAALETLVHRHYLFSRLVQFERGYVLDDQDDIHNAGAWLSTGSGAAPFFYRYDSPAQCAHLVSVCFHLTMYLERAFDAGTHLSVDVAHVLGWRAQRAIHWNDELQKKMLYFQFSRTVPSTTTLRDVQQTSWEVLRSPEAQARLYSVPVTTQIAQHIDENAQVMLQRKAYHIPIAFLSLTAQAIEPGVVRQAMMVLDKPPPDDATGDPASSSATTTSPVWVREGIICLTFRQNERSEAVEVELSGCMRCVDDRHAQFMLIDVGCVLVRWEHLVLSSRLLL